MIFTEQAFDSISKPYLKRGVRNDPQSRIVDEWSAWRLSARAVAIAVADTPAVDPPSEADQPRLTRSRWDRGTSTIWEFS
jgi:hypothetical protein